MQVVKGVSDKESEKNKLRKNYIKNEKWIDLSVVSRNEETSTDLYNNLASNTSRVVTFKETSSIYYEQLCPRFENINEILQSKEQRGTATANLILLDLPLMLRRIMINTTIISFSIIRELVPKKYTTPSIIDEIGNHAWLIQGLWIIKSEIVYDEPISSARNFLLTLFQKRSLVKRNEFTNSTKLAYNTVSNLFSELSYKTSDGWELKYFPEKEFKAE